MKEAEGFRLVVIDGAKDRKNEAHPGGDSFVGAVPAANQANNTVVHEVSLSDASLED